MNVFGVTNAYTLMNSAFGTDGANIASVEFVGALGETATFDLVEGQNIRDHNNGFYENSIAPGTASAVFSDLSGDSVRLDRQDYALPPAFAGDTLTDVIVTNNTSDADFVLGQAFIASLTVATPEPTSLILLGMGAAGLFCVARRTKG